MLSELLRELRALGETVKDFTAPIAPRRDQAHPNAYRRVNGRCPWRTQYNAETGNCERVGPTMTSIQKWGRNVASLRKK